MFLDLLEPKNAILSKKERACLCWASSIFEVPGGLEPPSPVLQTGP